MKPVAFPEQTHVLGKDQPEYQPLPVHMTPDGTAVSCWRLSWRERLYLLVTGRLWLMQLTFNQPLQPQIVQVDAPFEVPAEPLVKEAR